MKKLTITIFSVLILFFILSQGHLYASENNECQFAEKFLNTLKGKDFLNYNLKQYLIDFFDGTGKNRDENYYSFLIQLAWKWRKLEISSSIIEDYRIVTCDRTGEVVKVKTYLYFHYFLFFRKKILFTLPFISRDGRYLLNFPSLTSAPLE